MVNYILTISILYTKHLEKERNAKEFSWHLDIKFLFFFILFSPYLKYFFYYWMSSHTPNHQLNRKRSKLRKMVSMESREQLNQGS